jgi:release factor glutamine methyltransferase
MKLQEKDMKKVSFNDCIFYVSQEVYEPAEDTFLLAENLDVNESDVVIDVGTGCGILAILAAKKAKRAVATDINPYAVDCAKMNAQQNGVLAKMDIRLGNLFEPIKKNEKFDVIIFNAPYLTTNKDEEKENWIDRAWAGGQSGRDVIEPFVSEAPKYLKKKSRVFLVQSSLSAIDKTIQRFKESGLDATVVAEKKFPFETIVVVKAVFH